ncbi:zinc-binding dehydrogenase [Brevibacterium sp. 50QC2O2]|jgi:threonine dehydrogenase-like Zn-dependent dehydrogenase|uniref:zinc-dependent alcohol dehydrogenase n=1 Tax=Brevibacterium sp. 50QC2O2 TaxID=2968459 RepID=UPI00211CB66F|nr:zinc-binding dehydrogenase [Brevibacterium sp. 50QC2O2]MCQ9388205.1 zinc-binding dehydrogenase [Brevibacterium sp. 50QC2O2]
MRALVLTDFHQLDVVQVPTPEPGPDEVLLRIVATGICGSDFHGFTGENGRRIPGQIMGHESAGTIAGLGGGVDPAAYPIGAAATFNPVIVPAEDLAAYAGREQHHPDKTVVGVAHDYRASFADYVVVPARNIVLLDQDLPVALGALIEPVAVALHAVRRAGAAPDARAVVIGGGPIGQSVVLALLIEGITDIVLSEPSAPRRELAAGLGAHAVGPADGPLDEVVREHFGAPADLALDAVGITPTFADALKVTGLGGSVVLVGMGSPELSVPAFAISTEERTVFGSFTYTAQDFADAAAWVGTHADVVAPMVSETVTPDAAQDAFARLAAGAEVPGKILVGFADADADPDAEEALR